MWKKNLRRRTVSIRRLTLVDIGCYVAPLQVKERGMKRREKLNDGDGVVIHQHSKEHTKERGTEGGR